nr:unnamed protein product [Callosobruchus chinensis]
MLTERRVVGSRSCSGTNYFSNKLRDDVS